MRPFKRALGVGGEERFCSLTIGLREGEQVGEGFVGCFLGVLFHRPGEGFEKGSSSGMGKKGLAKNSPQRGGKGTQG